jgi:hypothetical protein
MAENALPLFANAGKYYVYVYRDPRPSKRRQPIYVGKGTAAQDRADYHWCKRACNPILNNVFAKQRKRGLVPVIEIVGWYDDENAAFSLEKALISKIGRRDNASGPLCNLTDGGDGPAGRIVSDETRTRLRSSHLGTKLSQKQLATLRAANLGRSLTPEHRAKLIASRLGKSHSEETRAKLRKAHLGRKTSDEHRRNISTAIKAHWERRRSTNNQDEALP